MTEERHDATADRLEACLHACEGLATADLAGNEKGWLAGLVQDCFRMEEDLRAAERLAARKDHWEAYQTLKRVNESLSAEIQTLRSATVAVNNTAERVTAVVTKMHELCCQIDKFPDFDDLGIETVKVKSALLRDIESKARDVMNALLEEWRAARSAIEPHPPSTRAYHPNLDGPTEPVGLSMPSDGNDGDKLP